MCDIAAPAVLDRCAAKFRERVHRFSDAWYLCVLADTRCRSELWESEFRRQSQFHDTNPELSVRAQSSVEQDLTEGIAPRRQGRRFASRSTGRQMDVPQFAHRIALTCASSVWSLTGRLSAGGTQVGHHQRCWKGKGNNKGER